MKGITFRDDILHEPIQQIGTILDIHVDIGKEFGQSLKNLIEMLENGISRDLGDIVEAFTSIIAHPRFGIVKAMQDGRQQYTQLVFRILH